MKMKKNIVLAAALLISISLLMVTSVLGEACLPVTIEKTPFCNTDPGNVEYSSNPPYYVGVKYYWWINMTVTAKMDLTGYRVVVFDRLGGEFMIEGICVDWTKQPDLPGYPNPGTTVNAPFDYTFEYSGGIYPEPEQNDQVNITDFDGDTVATGYVNDAGVTFQMEFGSGDVDTFNVVWTGNSCKAHLMWDIGPMEIDETKVIYLVISTDRNPAGHQEFTSPGITYLNSGATIKVLKPHPRKADFWTPIYSASTAPIPIIVEEN